jgi:hypothetical protein
VVGGDSALSPNGRQDMTEDIFASEFGPDRVNVGRSAVRSLNAASAHIEQSAVQHLTAEAVDATGSAFGVANAATLEVRDSAIGVAAGDYVKIEESRVFVLLAPRVSGNVRAFITLPAAFAFGAGFFLARRLLTAAFRREPKDE